MSKIGRKPIAFGQVKVEIKGSEIHFKGKNAEGIHLLPQEIQAHINEGKLVLSSAIDENTIKVRELWGLHRALLANKLSGANEKFQREMRINGLGFKAVSIGDKLQFSLGFSHKLDFSLPTGVSVEIDKTGQVLLLKAADKEILGHVCSKIRALRPPEPYKGTGVQRADEVIRRKVGKTK